MIAKRRKNKNKNGCHTSAKDFSSAAHGSINGAKDQTPQTCWSRKDSLQALESLMFLLIKDYLSTNTANVRHLKLYQCSIVLFYHHLSTLFNVCLSPKILHYLQMTHG